MLLEERYWAKVEVRGDDECWPWLASTQKGYGQIGSGDRNIKTPLKAHRLAWEFANGEKAPPGKVVMHLCDNPLCQNPRHLRLGSNHDNSQDAARKGRMRSKLTTEQILTIREMSRSGSSGCSIARTFGVVPQTVYDILSGHTWAWLK